MADNIAGQTITNGVDQSGSQYATGKIVYDATAITAADYTRVVTGFKPRYIKWVNVTDRTTIEWREGFGANECLKTIAAGTQTMDTTASAVVVDSVGFRILQNATLAAIFSGITDLAIDTTSNQTLEVTCQMSNGNNNNIIAVRSAILELI